MSSSRIIMPIAHFTSRKSERMVMIDESQRVLFDASKFPEFEERKKRQKRAATFVLIQGMVGTPLVYALVWVMLEVVTYTGIDPYFLGGIFIIVTIITEIIMYRLVRPALLLPWTRPERVTDMGLEHGGTLIQRDKIRKIVRMEYGVAIQVEGKRISIYPRLFRLESIDEFISALKEIAPSAEVQDKRRQKSP